MSVHTIRRNDGYSVITTVSGCNSISARTSQGVEEPTTLHGGSHALRSSSVRNSWGVCVTDVAREGVESRGSRD